MGGVSGLGAALGVEGGIVCAVGAGGKKSLLYALAAEAGARTALTATVMTTRFPPRLRAQVCVVEPEALAQQVPALAGTRLLAYARPSAKPGRLAGLEPRQVAALHAAGGFRLTLVKADGARMRGIKAPEADEPQLPPGTALLLPVLSIGVLGQPLDEATAHRPERLAAVCGAQLGQALTPAHLARLIASEQGALQHAGDARVVPVINQVDDPARRAQAIEVAQLALSLSPRFDRVALTCLRRGRVRVELVRRR